MAAAEAGLFSQRRNSQKYPNFFPYSRITLNAFEKRPYRVRLARTDDLPALLRLEEACWPEATGRKRELGLPLLGERRLGCFPTVDRFVRYAERLGWPD